MASKQTKKLRTSRLRGWKQQKPGVHERTLMLKRCGPRCFLGPNKTFPICKKHTCKVDPRGLLAAQIRASEWRTIRPNKTRKYSGIRNRAALLRNMASLM